MAKQNENKKNKGKNRNQGGFFGNQANASRGNSSNTPSGPSATTQGTPALNPPPKPLTSKEIEDKTIEENKKLIKIKKSDLLPPRLGYNYRGTQTTLITNCFQLHLADLPTLYRYHVDVKRQQDKAPVKAMTKELGTTTPESADPETEPTTTTQDTTQDPNATQDRNENQGQKGTAGGDDVDPFAHPKGAKLEHILYHFLNSNNAFREAIPLGNIASDFAATIISTRMLTDSERTSIIEYRGQKSKYRTDRFKFDTGVIAIPGFVSSIRPAAGRFLSNIQGTTGLFYKAGELSQLMIDFCGTKPDAKNLKEFHDFVKGVKVRLTYRDEKDGRGKKVWAIKTISGLAQKNDGKQSVPPQLDSKGKPIKALYPPLEFTVGAPVLGAKCNQIKLFRHEGKKVAEELKGKLLSVYEHIKEKYGDKAKSDDFAINVGTRLRPEYVPMACCDVIAGQTYRATLTSTEVAKMIELARETPKQNTDMISKDAADVLAFDEQTTITIPDKTLLTVAAWKLPSCIVLFGQQQVAKSHRWNMKNIVKYTAAGRLAADKWGILVIQGKAVDQVKVDTTVKLIKEKLRDRGVLKTATYTHICQDVSRAEVDDYDKMKAALEGRRLWFVFVPADFSLDEYKTLKQMADVQLGIHTCCMNMSKNTDNPQYCDNVLLKANLKCGGVKQTVKLPDMRIIDFNTTMAVGLDVTHPAPGAQGEQSIAAMVASIDSQLGQGPATMAQQTYSKDEVVFHEQGIKDLLEPHLGRWKTAYPKEVLPQQILVYRDGVSEGQYRQVVEYEYEHMKKVCKEVYKRSMKSLPRITIVIVGKRHHMRFFKKIDQLDIENPEPGTVVDREVTSQYLWEFYLQPHEPIQSTARPAQYVVVVNDIFSNMRMNLASFASPGYKNGSEVLIDVTHRLSYTMGRATSAIGVCTPAFLADKACDRARFYGPKPKVHFSMKDKMFYI
ncbi:Piwi domain-containing protein [Rhypophila decipiens]|uniref:Piwi domain-containing protein n=1 Tax=Rhypophila decipiens TaxID=261697 RepID=A0AAN6XVV3_9PEZI|nr:Piwi domain-containing protein [Rhypophila decipiens]